MKTQVLRLIESDAHCAESPRIPLKFLWIEVTRKCNLECVHCYENSSPKLPLMGSMTTQNWIGVLEQAFEIGVDKVQFIGGEPTLFPDLNLLIETAIRLKMGVEVYTNGTVIPGHLWSTFLANRVSLAFSYYSSDPTEHDKVTTSTGSHKRTRRAIAKAITLGLEVRVGIIQMPETSDASVQKTVAELEEIGVRNIGVDRTRGIGRGITKLSAIRNPFGELCGSCGNGKLVIDNNGKVYPCVFSKFSSLGHVSMGLARIAKGNEIELFRQELSLQRTPDSSKITFDESSFCSPDVSCRPTCCPEDCTP
jgi:MoaA/NifB/PqqE/SkfB family radical SAM enzyme